MATIGKNGTHDPAASAEFLIPLWQGRIRESILTAHKASGKCSLKIVEFSSKGKADIRVVAESDYEVGKLMLAPVSPNVVVVKKGSKSASQGSVDMGVVGEVDGQAYVGYVSEKFSKQQPSTRTDCHVKPTPPFMPPFWKVREATDGSSANMRIGSHAPSSTTCGYKVPVLINSKKIIAGQELLRPVAKPVKRPIAIADESLDGLVDTRAGVGAAGAESAQPASGKRS